MAWSQTSLMSFLENPIVQKALAGIVTAGVVAFGGMTIATRDKVLKHDIVLEEVIEMRKDVGQIKSDVAVLKDRATRDSRKDNQPDSGR